MTTPEPAAGRKTAQKPAQGTPPVLMAVQGKQGPMPALTAVPGPAQELTAVLTQAPVQAQKPAAAPQAAQKLMIQRPEAALAKVPAKSQEAERRTQDRIPAATLVQEKTVLDRISVIQGPAAAVQVKIQDRTAQTLIPMSKVVLKPITTLIPTVPDSPKSIGEDPLSVIQTIFPMLPVSQHRH